ncbi:hypothetical protein Srufu_057850 [Streptomyces libani subsp. rufus]|nr:hypothetical protein Srufu_057850 [Streptomyces libani subsp. rufus]
MGVGVSGRVPLADRSELATSGSPPLTITHSLNGRGRAGGAGVWDVKRSSPTHRPRRSVTAPTNHPARRRRNGEQAENIEARHKRRATTTVGKPKTWEAYVEPCQSSPLTMRPATIAPDMPAWAGPPPGCDQPPTA